MATFEQIVVAQDWALLGIGCVIMFLAGFFRDELRGKEK
jgi:hypothetical protein